MKRLLFLLTIVIIISGCNEKNTFTVDGIVKEKTDKSVFINRLDVDTPVFLDSTKVSKNGKFHFRIKASGPDFYIVGFSKNDFITILAEPGEKIKVVSEGKNIFEKYTISGSEGSEKLQTLELTLAETKSRLDSLSKVYNKASTEPGFDIKGPALSEDFTKVIHDQRKKNIEFILKNMNSLVSITALYQRIDPETFVLYDPHDLQYLKIVTDSLTRRYPNSKHVQALAQDFRKQMNQMYMDQVERTARKIPETKLDPDLTDITGKRITLSSLRGKYVLLTFWSANSDACVLENLQFKELYKLYSRKGFEIYQINLDQNEADWKRSVRYDELPWINTRENDPSNPKYALIFNVKNIPANYLFSKEGDIIATNLHGKYLQLKLEQIFN
jgi:thiol-disulfide isomerase/thioredoxin